ncbi:MAG: FkbM family methyltransferase [Alphaproteobacteria bacterium]|nr:FkbM family methyltransferase [Alphaproteobacteria bacterium]
MSKLRTIRTPVPGQAAIELVDYYPQFEVYFADCEMQTKQWCAQNIQPDWTIFDIGANIGYYSILFSCLASNGIVHAFEPTSTADMLDKNLAHNNCTNVHVHRTAISSRVETKEDKIFRIWGEEAEKSVYPFTTLDAFVAQHNIGRLDCIKIDVDSYELDVLIGAQHVLESFNPTIICEFNNAALLQRQTDSMALMEWFATRGYRTGLILDKENIVLKREVKKNDAQSFEFIYSNNHVAINDRNTGFYELAEDFPLKTTEILTCPQPPHNPLHVVTTAAQPNTAAMAIRFITDVKKKKQWVAELMVEVLKGEISVGIVDSKNNYVSTRRRIHACPQPQIIHLLIHEANEATETHFQCVAENINTSWQSSEFRLLSLRAYSL